MIGHPKLHSDEHSPTETEELEVPASGYNAQMPLLGADLLTADIIVAQHNIVSFGTNGLVDFITTAV